MKRRGKFKRFTQNEYQALREFDKECRKTDSRFKYYSPEEKIKKMKRLFCHQSVVN